LKNAKKLDDFIIHDPRLKISSISVSWNDIIGYFAYRKSLKLSISNIEVTVRAYPDSKGAKSKNVDNNVTKNFRETLANLQGNRINLLDILYTKYLNLCFFFSNLYRSFF
jgi:hypothetical protein